MPKKTQMRSRESVSRVREQEAAKSKPAARKEKELTNYTQDFIPVKAIRNGMIETTDGRYIKIIEVEPLNFIMRSEEEKANIVYAFSSWLKISNVRLQIKSITKKADPQRHIDLLKKDMAGETNRQTKELARAYIDLVREVGAQEALTRRFFIILDYEGANASGSYQEVYQTMQTAAQQVKKYLGQCGNTVTVPKNEDRFLAETLYMFFNRRSSQQESFRQRKQRVEHDWMLNKGLNPKTDDVPVIAPVNYIAPRGLDLSHASYYVMDGLYYSHLYIKADGYPRYVPAGWMNLLVNAGDGVDVDLFMTRMEKGEIAEKLARQIRLNMVKLNSTNSTQTDYEEIVSAIEGGQFLKESMSSGEDMIYVSIMITLTSPTLDGLYLLKKEMRNLLRSQDILTNDTTFEQEACLKSTMPFLQLDKEIFRKSKRNMLTSSAGACYMFTAFEMCDDNGILLGINQQNSSLCIVDIFNSKLYKNANMTIIGTSGSGKTFTVQLMALRMRMRGIQVFIIAPLKGHEFRRACRNIGGTYVKVAAGSKDCINIMEIHPKDQSADLAIEGEVEEDSMLAQKVQQLSVFFSLLCPNMEPEEQLKLEEAVLQTYFRKGITTDNKSVCNPDGSLKPMPVLGDLYAILSTDEDTQKLATTLNQLVNGSASNFNKPTNVNLDNKYIVMDISELKGRMLPIGMFIALDYCWDKIKEDRTKKKAIFIDETWMLIGDEHSNSYAANYVLEVFKIIRGYGGAAIAATQDLSDFFSLEGGKYGRGIINNSKTKIILNLEKDELDKVQEVLNLSRAEARSILQFERGQALVSTNANRFAVTMRPSDVEKALITTDRAELAGLAARR